MDNLGSSFNTDGSIAYSNGTLVSSEGATFFNNGTIKFSDGAVLHKDLQIIHADGTVVQGELFEEDKAEDNVDLSNDGEESEVDAGSGAQADEEDAVDTDDVEVDGDTGDEEEEQEADVADEVAKEGNQEEEEAGGIDEEETFEVVGTLNLAKITELWTAQQCGEVASASSNCTLLSYLKNATLLMQLMEALTEEDGPAVNTWSGIVQLMHKEGMTPDAKSFMTTVLAHTINSEDSGEGSQFGSQVHCDHRELSCRNGLACYSKTLHCDLKADCDDFSDEDSCSCKDRLGLMMISYSDFWTCQRS